MTEKRIEITCAPSRLAENERNRERLSAWGRFEPTRHPPVVFSISPRTIFHARGQEIGCYYEDPREQIEQQLLNHKWLIEHVVDDRVIDTRAVVVSPDLSTLRGGYFDVETERFNDGSICAVPMLREPEEIDVLEVPEVTSGHYGRMLRQYEQMQEIAPEYRVTLNGEELEVRVALHAGGGPIPDAYALAGEQLFLWMSTDPERVHRLFEIVTTAFVNLRRHILRLTGGSERNLGMGCDAGEMLSPRMFRELVVPYYRRCYEAFPGTRGLHMCGRIDHLLPILAEDLQITRLDGFGFPTSPELLAEHLGGRALMSGGLNPLLLLNGPVDAIRQETRRYINAFAECGGYLLQDGNNVAPGTPLAHLAAVVQERDQPDE